MPCTTSIPAESRLCAAWECAAQPGTTFALDNGDTVTILSRGSRNVTAGPDYLDAVVVLAGRTLVGDIELHVNEGEWFSHGHATDRRYYRVVLHVVASRATNRTTSLPTVVLPVDSASCQEAAHHESPDVEGHLLSTLAWERLLRLTEQAGADVQGRGPLAAMPWILRRAAGILGRPVNVGPMHEYVRRIVHQVNDSSDPTREVDDRMLLGVCGYAPDLLENDLRSRVSEYGCFGLSTGVPIAWRRDVRPSASPGRRILAVARITRALVSGDMFLLVVQQVLQGGVAAGADALVASVGGTAILGTERARTLVFDAVIPASLALAASSAEYRLIDQLIAAWRCAPALGTNAVVRTFQRLHLDGRPLVGGFWQAGAIEYQSRYGRSPGVRGAAVTGAQHRGWRVREPLGARRAQSTTTYLQ